MARQGHDGRWYSTLQELEEANQRWEQTQLLKKQAEQQRESIRKEERFRRQQELFQQEQARESARRYEEQAQREEARLRELRRQNDLLKYEQMQSEAEEEDRQFQQKYSASTAQYTQYWNDDLIGKVYPLLSEAGISDPGIFIAGLKKLYLKPEIAHPEKYKIDYIKRYPRYLLFRILHNIAVLDDTEDNEMIHRAMKECYDQLCSIGDSLSDALNSQQTSSPAPRRRRFFSVSRSSPDDKQNNSSWIGDGSSPEEVQAIDDINHVLTAYNLKIDSIFSPEQKKLSDFNDKIEEFEKRRVENFCLPLEYAFERLTAMEALYLRDHANDYRLQTQMYPPEYYEYKNKKKGVPKHTVSLSSDPTGLFQDLLNPDESGDDDDLFSIDNEKKEFIDWYLDLKESLDENKDSEQDHDNKDIIVDINTDPLFDRGVYYAVQIGRFSFSDLIHHLNISYTPGMELINLMIQRGIIQAVSQAIYKCMI